MRGPGHAIHQPPGPVSARHAVQGSPARREWSRAVPSSKHFEQSRRSHSAADTHCHHDVPGATPFPLDQGMADHTSTGHAVGWQTGRAACRERVRRYVKISVGAVTLKKKKETTITKEELR